MLGGQRGDPLGGGLGCPGRLVAFDARLVQGGGGAVHGGRRPGGARPALRDVGGQAGHRGLVAGALGAVRAGQLKGCPLRASREGRTGGAVGVLGGALDGLAGGQVSPGRRNVRVKLPCAVGDAQGGQGGRLGAQLPQPVVGVLQLVAPGR